MNFIKSYNKQNAVISDKSWSWNLLLFYWSTNLWYNT